MTFFVRGFIISGSSLTDMTKRNEEQILAAITHMAENELGGTIETTTTYSSGKRSSKKIIVEYDVKVNGESV